MSDQIPDHPGAESLRAFGAGKLEDDQTISNLAAHLETCHDCRVQLQDFPIDEFENLIRSTGAGQSDAGVRSASVTGQTVILRVSPTIEIPDRIGDYRILGFLGQGGMGVVYLAEDQRLKRRVALKVMKPELAADPRARRRFLREAQSAAAIEHDNLVTIFQVGEDGELPFLAMPLLKGQTLDQRLKTGPPLTLPQIVRIGRHAAAGLAAAHERGLIHRDIKPANLWLESEYGDRVKILDFGLALPAETDGHLTQSGTVVGTPAYMAPEQARGEEVDARSDLFSLGCVLYRLCTGHLPFKGNTTLALLTSLAVDQPDPPKRVHADIPAELSDLVLRLLSKNRTDRPASARDVVAALDACQLADVSSAAATATPVIVLEDEARPDQLTTRIARPAQRRRPPSAAVRIALAACLASGLAFGAYQLIFSTADSTLVVEVDDNAFAAQFTNGELRLTGADGKLQYTIKPRKADDLKTEGPHRFHVTTADGLEVDTDALTVRKNGKPVLKVTLKQVLDNRESRAVAKADSLKGDTGTVAPRPAQKPDQEKPFVLLRDGKLVREFKALAGALAELKANDEVVIHGNGPFTVGPVKVEGRGLVIRAAPGFRPRLVMSESVADELTPNPACLTVRGALSIEGCDLVGSVRVRFFDLGQGPFSLRRCRLLRCASIGVAFDGNVQIEDCLIHCHYGLGLFAGNVEMTNCVAISGHQLLTVGGGSSVHLRDNTLHVIGSLITVNPPVDGKPVEIELKNNVAVGVHFGNPPALVSVADKEWKKNVRWKGQDNLYAGRWAQPYLLPPDGKAWTLAPDEAEWNKIVDSEPGLRKAESVEFAWNRLDMPAPAAFASLCEVLGDVRRNEDLADIGPDMDRLGPGEPWLKMLAEKSGKAIPQDELRPEAQEGGPFVVLQDGKIVRHVNTLQEAFHAATDGDVIEIRTDGPRPAADLPAGKRAITVRAAPGYLPVLTGNLVIAENGELTLEGLHIDGWIVPAPEAHVSRISNCSIAWLIANTDDARRCRIVNSVIKTLKVMQKDGGEMALSGSVVGMFDLNPRDGTSKITLDHCAVWHPAPDFAFSTFDPVNKGTTEFIVRDSHFETGSVPFGAVPMRWSGQRNSYRFGGSYWQHSHGGTYGLAGWRKTFDSDEQGSIVGDPLLCDPALWRLPIDSGANGTASIPNRRGANLALNTER
ncbi:MAG: protein kinase [Planctomycetia bacterium]|nr:protein kinase [Planctomycetia bacterium]